MSASKKSLAITMSSVLSGLMLSVIAQPAQAFTFYSGGQATGTSAPAPPPGGAALATQTSFNNAAGLLGPVITDGFESPATNSTFYNSGTGTLTRTDFSLTVTNGETGQSDNGLNNTNGTFAIGYNTTVGGSRLVRIGHPTGSNPLQTSATFNFGVPMTAFGLYITDYGNTASAATELRVTINGATVTGFPRTIPKLNSGGFSNRSVQFFGFTQQPGDPLITSITFQFSGVTTAIDRLAMDDVRFVRVPVPPQFVGTALAAILAAWKVRRSKRKSKQADAPVG
ncbi:MAG: hypothetical protein KME35_18005 [Aphanocapsa sp. GSE-SYN-MK-11-07L]|jgi:hypothetical protein|nr:hypothetical protein [Aphanocapsa sp. GSE-SYN-MK-11-07L]